MRMELRPGGWYVHDGDAVAPTVASIQPAPGYREQWLTRVPVQCTGDYRAITGLVPAGIPFTIRPATAHSAVILTAQYPPTAHDTGDIS